MRKLKAVYLEWLDAHCRDGWRPPEREINLRVISVGLVVYEDDTRIVLSTARAEAADDEDGLFTEQFTIPKRAILRRRQLKL